MNTNEKSITEKSIYGVIQMNKQDNVIPLRRDIIQICDGRINAAIMLTQIIYWTDRVPELNAGWLWKSDREWFEETGLAEKQCDTARKILMDLGYIEIRYGVANAHRIRFYRPKTENIISALNNLFENGKPQNEEVKPQNEEVKPQNEEVKPQNEEVKPQNEEVKPQKGETITEITHSLSENIQSLFNNNFEKEDLEIKMDEFNLPIENFTSVQSSIDEGFAEAQPSENISLLSRIENTLENESNSDSLNRETPNLVGSVKCAFRETPSEEEYPVVLIEPDLPEDSEFLTQFNLAKFPNPDTKYLYKKVKPFLNSFWIKPKNHTLEDYLNLLYKAIYPGEFAIDGTANLALEVF